MGSRVQLSSAAVAGEPAEEDTTEAEETAVEEKAEEGFGCSLESTLSDQPHRVSC